MGAAQLMERTTKEQAVKSIEMIVLLLNNVLDPPDVAKAQRYRQVRFKNGQIKTNIVEVPNAVDLFSSSLPFSSRPPADENEQSPLDSARSSPNSKNTSSSLPRPPPTKFTPYELVPTSSPPL